MRTIIVEGCPCEVLEENTEAGIVSDNGEAYPVWSMFGNRSLVIAPDGSLVLPNPLCTSLVDPSQPDSYEMSAHLQRLAREMAR